LCFLSGASLRQWSSFLCLLHSWDSKHDPPYLPLYFTLRTDEQILLKIWHDLFNPSLLQFKVLLSQIAMFSMFGHYQMW
jgi:hypothetical protein